MINKGISIITDFGCNNSCFYCVWKEHKLNGCDKGNHFDYAKLFDFLNENKHLGKVSISGGGDPLYNYFGNLNFWTWLIKICEELEIKIDIHTREQITKNRFWKTHINRCSFSVDRLDEEIREYLIYLSQLTKVRLVHVITKDSSDDLIEELIGFCDEYNCQLTLKELYGFNDGGRYNDLKNKYGNDLFFLDYGDYNLYYMPNNTISDRFIV